MTNRNALTAIVALLALAGCGKHDSASQTGASSSGDTARIAAIASSVHPRPGRWEASVRIDRLDMPGMTQQMSDSMKSAMSAAPIASCITPAQSANPTGDFFSGQQHDCTYDKFTMSGGQMDAVMHCSERAMQMKMTMNGSYTETSYDIHTTSTAQMPGGRTLSQDMSVSSKWVGPCNGTEISARPQH